MTSLTNLFQKKKEITTNQISANPSISKSSWVASSSSNYQRSTASDGIDSGNFDYWHPATTAVGLANPWFSVDLSVEELVLEITIHIRARYLSRFGNVEIRVGNNDLSTTAVATKPLM